MIRSLNDFEAKLGYKVEDLNNILAQPDNHYHFARKKGVIKGQMVYRHFNPSKRNLKDVQNRLQSRIFSKIELPSHLHGSVRKKSNVTNAKAHQGKPYKLHTDLKSYFDFVSNRKVYNSLRTLGFSQKVANLITRLTTFQGHLAQGPPTSPFLANIGALDMDKAILQFCDEHGITYTRYVDDLGFSSMFDFKDRVPEIISIIEAHQFFIGYKKTFYKKGKLVLTGAEIHQNGLRPTKKQMEKYLQPDRSDASKRGYEIYFQSLK